MSFIRLIVFFLAVSCVGRTDNKTVEFFPMKVMDEDKQAELVLECKCEMKGGFKNGKNICRNETGNIIVEENYKDDVKTGEEIYFYPSGQIKMIRYLSKGKYEGKSNVYFSDGKLQVYRFFKDGKIVYEKEYDKDGEILVTGLSVNIDTIRAENTENIAFQISLEYSMYESIYLAALLDKNNDTVYDDTIVSKGKKLIYEIAPVQKGKNTLSGVLLEIESTTGEEVGQGEISYEYWVK